MAEFLKMVEVAEDQRSWGERVDSLIGAPITRNSQQQAREMVQMMWREMDATGERTFDQHCAMENLFKYLQRFEVVLYRGVDYRVEGNVIYHD